MRITPTNKGLQNLVQQKKLEAEKQVSTPKEKASKLPPAGYKPEFDPTMFKIREIESKKTPDSPTIQFLEKKVMRIDDNDGIPYVWLAMYQQAGESDTGVYLKGKQIYFPLERIYEVIDELTELADQCEKHNLI